MALFISGWLCALFFLLKNFRLARRRNAQDSQDVRKPLPRLSRFMCLRVSFLDLARSVSDLHAGEKRNGSLLVHEYRERVSFFRQKLGARRKTAVHSGCDLFSKQFLVLGRSRGGCEISGLRLDKMVNLI